MSQRVGLELMFVHGRRSSSCKPSPSAGHKCCAPAAFRVMALSIAVTTGETEKAAHTPAVASPHSFHASSRSGGLLASRGIRRPVEPQTR